MKRRLNLLSAAFVILLLTILSGCKADGSPESAPPSPPLQAETPAPLPEKGSPNGVIFPIPTSELYGLTSPYAELFDAIVEYQLETGQYDYKSCFTIPAFDILGSYKIGDGQEDCLPPDATTLIWGSYSVDASREVYILEHTVLLFGGYYPDEHSTGYGAERVYMRAVVETDGAECRVLSLECLLQEDRILQACEPIPALHDALYDALVLEKGEKPQPVWSSLPLEEALVIYLDACDVEVDYIIDWELNRFPIDDFLEEIANGWENAVHFPSPTRSGDGIH